MRRHVLVTVIHILDVNTKRVFSTYVQCLKIINVSDLLPEVHFFGYVLACVVFVDFSAHEKTQLSKKHKDRYEYCRSTVKITELRRTYNATT